MGYTWRKEAGVWKKVSSMYRKESGVWVPVKSGLQKVSGVYVSIFEAEVIVDITTNQTNLVLKDLFTSDDWTSGKAKTVHIHTGVTVSPTSGAPSWALAPQGATETTIWGGTLTLINDGIIQGMGGAANSGVGGNALYVGTVSNGTKKLQIKNNGTIRSGGGGGGKGGNGGGGQYNYTATEGPYYVRSGTEYYWQIPGSSGTGNAILVWGDGTVTSTLDKSATSFVSGTYTYYRGTYQGTDASSGINRDYYSIYRQYTATANTSGGTGGNGGRGQGADGANASGTAGAGGGTNAGTGGTGGTGGTWGNSGAVGFTGSSGNRTAGTAGTAGGAAGYAYSTVLHNIVTPGIILGRVA
ncbi:hypothetical protein PP744_gp085 [Rhizobium phage RHph_N38]|uniref:Uncharacterized protein n=1 Tax=Rhizobium phage RHph_N38 TaxID=2509750 RepID=A0A7S5UUQ2_9CAUD|nr:hypothetical protein PP744_gp085 [Rhizobium phage RHph_N38]QIG70548.1 hypothetical protein EVB89_085 [Rhizobium phage RHph_N38]